MSGFAALNKFDGSTAEPIPSGALESMAFLRKAINAPDMDEVQQMIKNTMYEFNVLNKIELKINGETKPLPDVPRHFLFPDILTTVNANIPTMLVGPAGSGKSTVCEQVASALELKYYLQNSVTGTHEVAGYLDAHGKYHTTTFREAFARGGLILVDEADTSDAAALKWLNTALAQGYAMFPDQPEPVNRHKDFRVIMAANTFGTGADRVYVGANQLDASTLDRFVFFQFDYDEKMEIVLSGNADWAERVQELRKAAKEERARVVISPRATIHGAKLLALGWHKDKVEESVIWKGMDPEMKRRILDHVSGAATVSVGLKKKAK